MTHKKYIINVLLFDDFELLDVFGPLEMFSILPEHFQINIISEQEGLITGHGGVEINCPYSFQNTPKGDILMIPGGQGTRKIIDNKNVIAWIKTQGPKHPYVFSICTGAALLAKSSQLDGASATTNKLAYDWVISQGPKVNWEFKPRWIQSGKFWTSAGISAGIDMSLTFIEKLLGTETANKVTNYAEYGWNKNSSQ